MMWSVPGRQVEASRFEPFTPVTVLYEFDGPRTFTVTDADGELCLAHWCDEDDETSRFLVAPTDSRRLAQLQAGDVTLVEALRQTRLWVVDVASERVSAVWRTELGDLPEEVLPVAGTMLLPSLEPFLSVRAIGKQIEPGWVPASVIRTIVDGVQKVLKQLLEGILDVGTSQGRPTDAVRRLYDLPAQHFAFNSFEISFRRPPRVHEPDLLEGTDLDRNREDEAIVAQVGDQLYSALEFASVLSQGGPTVPPSGTESPGRRVLESLLSLAPTTDGALNAVEVSGTFARGRTTKPYRLTSQTRQGVRRHLSLLPKATVEYLTVRGRVRELDRDRMQFEVRDIEGGRQDQRFVCTDELIEEALDALGSGAEVDVMGLSSSDSPVAKLLAISPVPRADS